MKNDLNSVNWPLGNAALVFEKARSLEALSGANRLYVVSRLDIRNRPFRRIGLWTDKIKCQEYLGQLQRWCLKHTTDISISVTCEDLQSWKLILTIGKSIIDWNLYRETNILQDRLCFQIQSEAFLRFMINYIPLQSRPEIEYQKKCHNKKCWKSYLIFYSNSNKKLYYLC